MSDVCSTWPFSEPLSWMRESPSLAGVGSNKLLWRGRSSRRISSIWLSTVERNLPSKNFTVLDQLATLLCTQQGHLQERASKNRMSLHKLHLNSCAYRGRQNEWGYCRWALHNVQHKARAWESSLHWQGMQWTLSMTVRSSLSARLFDWGQYVLETSWLIALGVEGPTVLLFCSPWIRRSSDKSMMVEW